MVASYPTSVRIFTTKVDNDDINYAAHINDLQDEVVALQQTIGTSPQGSFGTLKARVGDLETGKSDVTHNHSHNSLTGLTTGNPHTQYLLRSVLTTKGDIAVFDGTGWARLGVGADGSGLVADSSTSTGLRWSASNAVTSSSYTAKGDVLVGTGSETFAALSVGPNGRALLADSSTSTGLAWSGTAPLLNGDFDAKGDLLVGTGSNTKTRLPIGSNGEVPVADDGEASGVRWGNDLVLGGYSEKQDSTSGSGTWTLDLSATNVFLRTLTGATTVAISGAVAGRTYSATLIVTQDATGGRTLSFPAGTKTPNGVALSPDTAAGAVNVYTYITTDGGASGYAFLSGRAMA